MKCLKCGWSNSETAAYCQNCHSYLAELPGMESLNTFKSLILGLLIKSPKKIKIVGDKSLSRRDFSRVTIPLTKFGAKFYYKTKNKLPISILGSPSAKAIRYIENKFF